MWRAVPAGVDGIAFFDKRMVRTLACHLYGRRQTVGTDRSRRYHVLRRAGRLFPPAKWLDLFRNRVLNQDLAIGRGIPHITGASLTSQAMNDGIRLILATYEVAVKGGLQ